jgi:hypothetical protein
MRYQKVVKKKKKKKTRYLGAQWDNSTNRFSLNEAGTGG